MPRIPTRLGSDLAIRKLKPKAEQTYPLRFAVAGEPTGLYIQMTPTGAKTWLLRVTTGSKPHPSDPNKRLQIRREFGLGGYPVVTLQMARERASAYLAQVAEGVNPSASKKATSEVSGDQQAGVTFADCERQTLEIKAPSFKNPAKSRNGWRTRMDLYANPAIGTRAIETLDEDDIEAVLKPLWRDKFPTAKKLLHDLAAVFGYAKAKKLYTKTNPATMEAMEPLLGKPSHSKKHFPSLPYERVTEFMRALRSVEGDAARALEFAILTASRSDEARSAKWSEFDLKRQLWTVPAKRMKRDRDHCVPLSKAAIRVLEGQLGNHSEYPFTNAKGIPFSDMALSALVKRMHAASIKAGGAGFKDPVYDKVATPHGFRSSFKDWARNLTSYADELSELALAHVNSDATRAAYARDALLKPRVGLMADWADHCEGHASRTAGQPEHRSRG